MVPLVLIAAVAANDNVCGEPPADAVSSCAYELVSKLAGTSTNTDEISSLDNITGCCDEMADLDRLNVCGDWNSTEFVDSQLQVETETGGALLFSDSETINSAWCSDTVEIDNVTTTVTAYGVNPIWLFAYNDAVAISPRFLVRQGYEVMFYGNVSGLDGPGVRSLAIANVSETSVTLVCNSWNAGVFEVTLPLDTPPQKHENASLFFEDGSGTSLAMDTMQADAPVMRVPGLGVIYPTSPTTTAVHGPGDDGATIQVPSGHTLVAPSLKFANTAYSYGGLKIYKIDLATGSVVGEAKGRVNMHNVIAQELSDGTVMVCDRFHDFVANPAAFYEIITNASDADYEMRCVRCEFVNRRCSHVPFPAKGTGVLGASTITECGGQVHVTALDMKSWVVKTMSPLLSLMFGGLAGIIAGAAAFTDGLVQGQLYCFGSLGSQGGFIVTPPCSEVVPSDSGGNPTWSRYVTFIQNVTITRQEVFDASVTSIAAGLILAAIDQDCTWLHNSTGFDVFTMDMADSSVFGHVTKNGFGWTTTLGVGAAECFDGDMVFAPQTDDNHALLLTQGELFTFVQSPAPPSPPRPEPSTMGWVWVMVVGIVVVAAVFAVLLV